MSLQSWLTHCKFRFEKKLFLSLVSADEEEEHLRQIEELEEGRAKKDAELTQLRSDLAQIRETGQVSQVDVGRGKNHFLQFRSVPGMQFIYKMLSISRVWKRDENTAPVSLSRVLW